MPTHLDLVAIDSAARIAGLTGWEIAQATHDCEVLRVIFNADVHPFDRTVARARILSLSATLRPFGWTATAEDITESPIVLQLEKARNEPRATPLRFPPAG